MTLGVVPAVILTVFIFTSYHSTAFRAATQIFGSANEEAEFGRSVAPRLKKHMALPMDEFRAAVKGAAWLKLDGPLKAKTGKLPGRPKKGYAYVDDDGSVGSAAGALHGGAESGAAGGGSSDEEYHAAHKHAKGAASANKVKVKFRANSVDESVLSQSSANGGTGRGRGRPKRVQPLAVEEGEVV